MNKQEFLACLAKGLSGLSQSDIEEHLTFYGEMIDDRIEEGLSEEEAVSAIGNIDEVISQIVADTPFTKLVKQKINPNRRLKIWEIVLLALGSPIWLSLLIAAAAVLLSIYISLWAVIISLWSVFVAFIGYALGAIVAGFVFASNNNILTGIAIIGTGIFSVGLSIFTFFGCKSVTKCFCLLTKKLAIRIKTALLERRKYN